LTLSSGKPSVNIKMLERYHHDVRTTLTLDDDVANQHWPLLRRLLIGGQAWGPLATDAQLAALTIEYGGVLQTTDRDFARFPELQWTNPIEAGTERV
jgi:predicted nucleic acid-binding protein